MRLPRFRCLLVSTLATTVGASAQVNAGKPVLSAPPPVRTDTPAATTPTTLPPQPVGQTSAPPADQAPGTPAEGVALPAAGTGVVPSTYVIGPDDTISVNVWKEPSLSGTLPVRPDGMISLALIGDLQAAGFTPMRLSQDIAERLKKFVNDPNVTITVTAVNSKKIYLIGEVGHVGPQTLSAGLTPLEAIATAGGINPFANGKHIYILRTVGGKQVRLPFDYKKAVKTGDQQGITLLPDDKIVVP